jgi:hypothetical protein
VLTPSDDLEREAEEEVVACPQAGGVIACTVCLRGDRVRSMFSLVEFGSTNAKPIWRSIHVLVCVRHESEMSLSGLYGGSVIYVLKRLFSRRRHEPMMRPKTLKSCIPNSGRRFYDSSALT